MGIEKLLKDVQILALVCNQYGDTGKGKFSDLFAREWADVTARGTGGTNAGHGVVFEGRERIFHLVPAGVAYDKNGKINILGNGMVIDPSMLVKELDELDSLGISYNNLMISDQAHITLPFHVATDKAKDVSQALGGIGSTGRGIGPTYADKIARRGILVRDLFDRDSLQRKIKKSALNYLVDIGIEEESNIIKPVIKEIRSINIDEMIEGLRPLADRIKPFVRDTVSEMHKFVRQGKRICLEGAQGLLLSVEHGTYNYVTSSDCSINGTASGVGLSAKAVDLTLGIVKFPFMTRVGGGPFPTELGGKDAEKYCAETDTDGLPAHRKKVELLEASLAVSEQDEKLTYNNKDQKLLELLNSSDDFSRGIGIRIAANEYGATTRRPRRIGWTDAVAGRYAVGVNGPLKLVLTKADSVFGMKEFKICFEYKFPSGENCSDFPRDPKLLRNIVPQYETFEGYEDIREAKKYEQLPRGLKKSIARFEEFVGASTAIVSTGREASETIIR